MSSPVLVTGAAGFIGFHVARRLLESGVRVVGVDSFTSYYDPSLKEARFAELAARKGFAGARVDLADEAATRALFAEHRPQRVVHLAAQPGVRRALTDPHPHIRRAAQRSLERYEASRSKEITDERKSHGADA